MLDLSSPKFPTAMARGGARPATSLFYLHKPGLLLRQKRYPRRLNFFRPLDLQINGSGSPHKILQGSASPFITV